MYESPRVFRNCVLWAVVAAAMAFSWQALTVRYNFDGNWTALFCTGNVKPVPAELQRSTYVFPNSTGYDGQWYRYVAHDPLDEKGYWQHIDNPRLRSRRILIPALAYLFGLGRPEWIDGAFTFLVLLSVAAGVYWSARWISSRGHSPAWGLLFLLLPATLASIDRLLVDAALTALFAAFWLYTDRDQFAPACLAVAAAALTRETGLFCVVALAGFELWRRNVLRSIIALSTAAPTAAWYLFVATRVPAAQTQDFIEYPVIGLIMRAFTFRNLQQPQIVVAAVRGLDLAAILGFTATIVIALLWCWRKGPSAVTLAVALFAALGLAFGNQPYLEEAFGYGRPASPLVLFVMLNALHTRAWMPLAASLAMTPSVLVSFLSYAVKIARKMVG